jgi:hypothetical protein
MKFLRSLLLTSLLCSTSIAAASDDSSDKQTLVAHKMDPTTTTTESIDAEINAATTETNSNINVETTNFDSEVPEPMLERQAVEAQVMLGNVDMEDLNAEETMYFESALRKAIQLAQDDRVTIGGILVENGHGAHKHDGGQQQQQQQHDDGGRHLRSGDRALWFKWKKPSWFSIWALIETTRCRYCPDDDDWVYEPFAPSASPSATPSTAPTFSPTAPTPAPTTKWERYQMDDDYLYPGTRNRNGGGRIGVGGGGGRRSLGVSESNTSLEDILCKLLREGPHECFHSVDECTVEVSEW